MDAQPSDMPAARCDFPDESDELEYLLAIYRERSETFALEAARALLAG